MKKLLATVLLTALATVSFAKSEETFTLKEAEAVFWHCDAMASKTMADPTDAAICSEAYEVLLKQKFGGDFNKLLAWWKANKPK